jgi:hypothetical protein
MAKPFVNIRSHQSSKYQIMSLNYKHVRQSIAEYIALIVKKSGETKMPRSSPKFFITWSQWRTSMSPLKIRSICEGSP